MTMTKTFIAIGTMICAAVATPTFAQSSVTDALQRTITYADLNLATPAGRAQFDARMQRAIKEVCPAAETRDVAAASDVRSCRRETRARVAATRAAVLAAYSAPHAEQLALLAAK